MMRVIFLTQWFDPEPGAIRGLPLARWLAARGHDVQVLTGVPNYPGGRVYPGYRMRLWQREVMDGVPVLRVPLYPSHDASAPGRVLAAMKCSAAQRACRAHDPSPCCKPAGNSYNPPRETARGVGANPFSLATWAVASLWHPGGTEIALSPTNLQQLLGL